VRHQVVHEAYHACACEVVELEILLPFEVNELVTGVRNIWDREGKVVG